jgi:hypothetical protein
VTQLDPKHELPAGHELLDLPPPHHDAGWGWLFSLVIGTVSTFVVTIVLIATAANPALIVAVALVTFIFVTLLTRGVADHAL